jgi:hypothetical protein
VALTATDAAPGSGIRRIEYSATGAQTIGLTPADAPAGSMTFTTNVTIANVGTTTITLTITFFATDNAGNSNFAQPQTVAVTVPNTCPPTPPN